ncbi:MAG: Ribonuclease HII [Parcubacteria group bacterium GW2011_GWA2_47_12]|nr:MAG: Ribonuclease HII [Parcubacteria group bacterium GW2011_GWA2_47_12]
MKFIVGIDEVGRGPLAGPLCIGACAVEAGKMRVCRRAFAGVKDCKQLSPAQREKWFAMIQKNESGGIVQFATAFVGHRFIDQKGMARALRIGICRVLKRLNIEPTACKVLLDGGLKAPAQFTKQKTIIRGDETETLIALASIVAKVRRDRRMIRLAKLFPKYGFDIHKGYGTRQHYKMLRKHGVCDIHRQSFIHLSLQK